jgi:hypothetical protein
MTYLVVGIILIVLLVGVSLLQWALRQRQAARERALPHVSELAALALSETERPAGYHVEYRGPVTNERLAYESPNERASLAELDEQGRVIGYVGATGWATGPHLHYEFLVDGVHTNPRRVSMPPAEPIDAVERDRFDAETSALLASLSSRKKDRELAYLSPLVSSGED